MKTIEFSLQEQLLAEIEKTAKRKGMTVNEYLRRLALLDTLRSSKHTLQPGLDVADDDSVTVRMANYYLSFAIREGADEILYTKVDDSYEISFIAQGNRKLIGEPMPLHIARLVFTRYQEMTELARGEYMVGFIVRGGKCQMVTNGAAYDMRFHWIGDPTASLNLRIDILKSS